MRAPSAAQDSGDDPHAEAARVRDAFIEKHDVPDYRAQFMSAEPAETAAD